MRGSHWIVLTPVAILSLVLVARGPTPTPVPPTDTATPLPPTETIFGLTFESEIIT